MTAHNAQTAVLGAEGVSASTGYVLVDLSDTTNYKHAGSTAVHLLGVSVTAEVQTDGIYDIWLGVITEVDASDGSASWIHCFHCEGRENDGDGLGHFAWDIDFTRSGHIPEGVDCRVISGALQRIVTNQTLASNVLWQTDTGLASPVGAAAGATGKPGAGDLVVYAEEVGGTGTLDFCITAQYKTV